MKELELRRHSLREKGVDVLTAEGRVRAEDVGRTLRKDFAVIFVSPANRAAETVAWFLRASGQPLPEHAVVGGLASDREREWRATAKAAGSSRLDAMLREDRDLVEGETRRLARVLGELLERVPDGGVGLAVGHSPLIEAGVHGLTGTILDPLAECEGVSVIREDDGAYRIVEHRLQP